MAYLTTTPCRPSRMACTAAHFAAWSASSRAMRDSSSAAFSGGRSLDHSCGGSRRAFLACLLRVPAAGPAPAPAPASEGASGAGSASTVDSGGCSGLADPSRLASEAVRTAPACCSAGCSASCSSDTVGEAAAPGSAAMAEGVVRSEDIETEIRRTPRCGGTGGAARTSPPGN